MYTTKSIQPLPNQPVALPDPSIEPLPEIRQPLVHEIEDVAGALVEDAAAHLPGHRRPAEEIWKNLPEKEQGVLSHLAKSAEEFCTPEHLAKMGKSVEAIGSLVAKGIISKSPFGALNILDPLLKDIAGESSMHFEASGSIAEGGPKTFQFSFGMTSNVRKLQAGH